MSHQLLNQISNNLNYKDDVKDRFELTSNWYSHIVDYAADDQISKTIADNFEISFTTVKIILSQTESCYNKKSWTLRFSWMKDFFMKWWMFDWVRLKQATAMSISHICTKMR